MPRYDHIVVGGGSAGCIAAARLAEDPAKRVLLLESGPSPEQHPETLAADGYKDAFINDAVIWERFSTKQRECGDRHLFMGSGTGLGGSGSVNGMVYTRGDAGDYDEWPVGWRWNDVESDFAAVESRLRVRRRPPTEWTEACIAAASDTGFHRSDDLNDGQLTGALGYEWMNFEGDRRRSSFVAYVRDVDRPNLTVETGARAHRVRLDGDGRAIGVDYAVDGDLRCADSDADIVLSAGALETPKLLMLSGIGPGEVLRRHGVAVRHAAPEVGRNLHDHPNVALFFLGDRDVDCHYPQLYGFHRANPLSQLPHGRPDTCYVFYPARSSLAEAAQRMGPALALPPALYRVAPVKKALRGVIGAAFAPGLVKRFINRVYGIVVILGKPESRGTVRLASADPTARADLNPAYLSSPADLATLVDGVKLARRTAKAPALAAWGNRPLSPFGAWKGDADAAAFVRKNIMTTYHFAGTCRMGDDADSVVDARLRVRGVPNLRVADASAVPTTPVAAMNAPSMLVGHRAADFIREEQRHGASS